MVDEKIIIGKDSRYPLNGILTLPDNLDGASPAVVLVHGSGPSDKDEHIGNTYFFKDLAEGLSRQGIAVLRYDKRTYVYGKDMRGNPDLSVKEETIDDAILATKLLRNDSRIHSNKLFIIGHSLGGMLAPRIDTEGGDFAGIIIMAGSPRKLEEIIMDQNQEVLNSLNKLLRMIAKRQITALSSKFNNIYNLSDEEAKSTSVLGKHINAFYFKEMGEHPSAYYLSELNKPIFVLQGDKDFQVSIDKDFNVYKELLRNNPNVSFKLYPNLNHLFMPSVYGKILKAKKEYKVAQKVDESVIMDISNWINQRQ